MAFNARAMHWVLREKWKCEHIDLFGVIETKSGKRRNHYNYQSGMTKRIWDAMLDELRRNGVANADIPQILATCGLSQASIKRKMEGREETHLYELEHILKAANYSIVFNPSEKEIFRVTRYLPVYQITEELDRVVIKRNLYPKMHINFNPNDLTDLEIDFGKEKIFNKIGVFKLTDLVIPAMLQYFNKESEKTLTKIKKAVRSEIRRQWLNEDIIIKNKAKLKQ